MQSLHQKPPKFETINENKFILPSVKSLYSHRRIQLGWHFQRPPSPASCSEQVQLQDTAQAMYMPVLSNSVDRDVKFPLGTCASVTHPYGEKNCPWSEFCLLSIVLSQHISEKSLVSTFSGLFHLRIIDSNIVSLTLFFSASPYSSVSHVHPVLWPTDCFDGPPLGLLQYDTIFHKLGNPVWTWHP